MDYEETPATGKITFTVPTNRVRFKNLDELSTLLGTELIDMCNETERECNSSFGFRPFCNIECYDIDFPERLKDVVEKVRPYTGVSEF